LPCALFPVRDHPSLPDRDGHEPETIRPPPLPSASPATQVTATAGAPRCSRLAAQVTACWRAGMLVSAKAGDVPGSIAGAAHACRRLLLSRGPDRLLAQGFAHRDFEAGVPERCSVGVGIPCADLLAPRRGGTGWGKRSLLDAAGEDASRRVCGRCSDADPAPPGASCPRLRRIARVNG
jgi:hypothetical protein